MFREAAEKDRTVVSDLPIVPRQHRVVSDSPAFSVRFFGPKSSDRDAFRRFRAALYGGTLWYSVKKTTTRTSMHFFPSSEIPTRSRLKIAEREKKEEGSYSIFFKLWPSARGNRSSVNSVVFVIPYSNQSVLHLCRSFSLPPSLSAVFPSSQSLALWVILNEQSFWRSKNFFLKYKLLWTVHNITYKYIHIYI